MMPPISRVDADAYAKLHACRIPIISDATPPIASTGQPILRGSTV